MTFIYCCCTSAVSSSAATETLPEAPAALVKTSPSSSLICQLAAGLFLPLRQVTRRARTQEIDVVPMFEKKPNNNRLKSYFMRDAASIEAGAAVAGKMLLTCFPRQCCWRQPLLRICQVHRLFMDEWLTGSGSDAEQAPMCFSSVICEKKSFQSDSSVDKIPGVLLQLQSFPSSSGPARPLGHHTAEVLNSLVNEHSSGTRWLQVA